MSFLEQISVLILTYNEAANIGRTLEALRRFPEIVVLDSCSSDATAQIVLGFANTRLLTRQFDDHASQWTYGLTECGLQRPWVLALDADYIVGSDAVREMAALEPASTVAGYRVGFDYLIWSRRIRGSLYPPVVALYRRSTAHYVQDGHTQRVVVTGEVGALTARFGHDDRKPLRRWIASQQRYAEIEADHLLRLDLAALSRADRLRRVGWPAPFVVFLYVLLVRGCILDGWPGLFYALQRMLAETMIALEIVDRRLAAQTKAHP